MRVRHAGNVPRILLLTACLFCMADFSPRPDAVLFSNTVLGRVLLQLAPTGAHAQLDRQRHAQLHHAFHDAPYHACDLRQRIHLDLQQQLIVDL
eukprot:363516-Chlamydomonas_euryale.AAC.22